MLVQAAIFRVSDGLPLSASTDMDHRPQVREYHKYVKMLSKRLTHLPDRCALHLNGFNIHLITGLGLGFLVLTEDSYPTVLAFCFLDDIQREFIMQYDTNRVDSARRPYAFIEFDNYLQKTKQKYNNPRSLTTRVNLADMSTELKLRPPSTLTEQDLGLGNNAVTKEYTNTYRPTVGPGRRLVPLNWYEWLSVVMNLFCAALTLTRGMAIISHGHFDEDDIGAYRYGSAFLFTTILHVYQVYLIFFFGKWRKCQTWGVLLVLCCCNYYLSHFRNGIQLMFYFSVVMVATYVILNRQLTEKLPGYAV